MPDTSPSPPTVAAATYLPASTRELRLVYAAALLAIGLSALDSTIVNNALPRIASELGGLSHLSWVVTAFMMASTISTPLYGKLSDMFGRKRLFTIAICIYMSGSLLCSIAHSLGELILFRFLQGLGSGGVSTLALSIIASLIPPRERGRYQGWTTSTYAISTVVGPLIGGVIVTELSWRWIFYVNLPFAAFVLALMRFGLRHEFARHRHQIDYAGAALLAPATIGTLMMLSWGGSVIPWLSGTMALIAGLSVTLATLFVRQEKRAAEPFIDLRMFSTRSTSAGVACSFIMTFALLGTTILLPLYYQLVLGMTPTGAGLMILPQVSAMTVSSIIGGRLVSWTGHFKPFLVTAIIIEIISLGGLAFAAYFGASALMFGIAVGGLGLGMGMGNSNASVAVQNSVPVAVMGTVTATMAFARSLGGSAGVALSGGIMSGRLRSLLANGPLQLDPHELADRGVTLITKLPPEQQALIRSDYGEAISTSFMFSVALMGLALYAAWRIPPMILRGRETEQPAPV